MAWTSTQGSHVFQEFVSMTFQASGTGWTGLDSDTVNVALFNNTGTPDPTAAVASTGYNTGQWVVANEQTDATNWVAGGRALAGKTFTFPAGSTFMFDATDLSGGGNMTVANVYGCLNYDNTITGGTVAKQGVNFTYFGGVQGVTSGTFTIIWHVNGIIRGTV